MSVEYDKLPGIQDIFGGQKNQQAYGLFCDYFLGYGVSDGADRFKARKVKEKISDIATVVDEAFVLLALENGHEMWKHQVMKAHLMETVRREGVVTWKWTANARVCKMGEGWQKEGLTRFNELCRFVMEDRKREHGPQTFGFENWYLKNCQEHINLKKRKKSLFSSSISVTAFNMLDYKNLDNEFEVTSYVALED